MPDATVAVTLTDIDPQLAQHVEYELGLTKKNGNGTGTRKNAWGNLSYAELISKAISTSAEQRLTLAEIYDWMIKYVPFFRNKVDRVSSAGWKVSFERGEKLPTLFLRLVHRSELDPAQFVVAQSLQTDPERRRRQIVLVDHQSR